MRLIAAIDRKVLRDAWRMRGQLVAIALVIACGVGLFLGMRSTMRALASARSTYYARERFGDVFVRLVRAPEHVAERLRTIQGVQRVQTRVVADATLDLPGVVEAVTGRLVSLPDRGRPAVDDVRLASGRMPERPGEALASVAFAEAHAFPLGARIAALIDGKRQELALVGTALSPEFTYAPGPGQLFPDDRRFGILWLRRAELAAALDMDGAFSAASLRLARGASPDAVIARVDALLERYGGLGAIPRAEQTSAFFIENELRQLATFGTMVPLLFLLVAAFLLNVVVGRIVAGQREMIAVLKALGYHDREVALHYAKLVAIVLLLGLLLGIALGGALGAAMTRMYGRYYRFPELPYRLGLDETLRAAGVGILAAALGTLGALRQVVRLQPAEAMRPAAPAVYRALLFERLGLAQLVPGAARIVLRELERRPARALLSALCIAMATALVVVSTFTFDSVRHVMNVQFGLQQRADVQLTLSEPRAIDVLHDLEHLPGVVHAEGFRAVPVRLRAGRRAKETAIVGIPRDAHLQTVLDAELAPIAIPARGLVLSRELADILDVGLGDELVVEVLEGARTVRQTRVARIATTFVGLSAHMELAALCALLGETVSASGAWLLVDEAELDELHAAVKATPSIAGVSARSDTLASMQTILDENLGTSVGISLAFALVMALGVLYNAARIALAERARELASLRVLGFRRREVGAILLGELFVLVAAATPLGLLLGRVFAGLLVSSPGYATEEFRLPLVIAPSTYALASLAVFTAALLSAVSAWRKLDALDIIAVLKTRD